MKTTNRVLAQAKKLGMMEAGYAYFVYEQLLDCEKDTKEVSSEYKKRILQKIPEKLRKSLKVPHSFSAAC